MKNVLLAGLPLVLLAGCTSANQSAPPEVVAYQSPVDAHAGIRHQGDLSVTRDFNRRDVIEPSRWRDRNVESSENEEPGS